MQKFIKKLKTEPRTDFTPVPSSLPYKFKLLIIFFGHILYKGRPSFHNFLLGKQIVLPRSFAGGGNGHTEKLTKNLTLPISLLLQQRGKEIRHHYLTTIFILLSFTQQMLQLELLVLFFTNGIYMALTTGVYLNIVSFRNTVSEVSMSVC